MQNKTVLDQIVLFKNKEGKTEEDIKKEMDKIVDLLTPKVAKEMQE